MLVKNKTIVVTGGGSGIGRELVLALLRKGAIVAAVDLNEISLLETQQLAGEKSENLSLHILNITDKAAVEALPEQIIDKHCQVDWLINNAGIIQPFVKVNDLDYKDIERVMNVNFYGLLYMTKSFLPKLLDRPEAHIVNISSMGGFLPVPGQTVYGASKAAVKLLTEGLNSEMRGTNVRVTVVFPGAIATNISINSGLKNIAPQEPDSGKNSMQALPAPKAAEIILNAMEKNKYRVCVGKDSQFLDFLYRMFPEYAAGFIAKKMASLLK